MEPGQIDVLATKAEDALIAAGLPVFQRGSMLVRPAAWSVPASDERNTLAAGLRPINAAALVDLLAQAANFTRFSGRRKKSRPIDPPSRYRRRPAQPERLLACAHHRRDDHHTHHAARRLDPPEAGFDPTTRLYHWVDPDLHLPPIGTTRADAERPWSS